jgi:hypothetical protein
MGSILLLSVRDWEGRSTYRRNSQPLETDAMKKTLAVLAALAFAMPAFAQDKKMEKMEKKGDMKKDEMKKGDGMMKKDEMPKK